MIFSQTCRRRLTIQQMLVARPKFPESLPSRRAQGAAGRNEVRVVPGGNLRHFRVSIAHTSPGPPQLSDCRSAPGLPAGTGVPPACASAYFIRLLLLSAISNRQLVSSNVYTADAPHFEIDLTDCYRIYLRVYLCLYHHYLYFLQPIKIYDSTKMVNKVR